MFDYLVIGKGLIGSAATKYLAEQSESIAVIGANEPSNWSEHKGVFASHYDQGRVTRVLAEDLVWAELAAKSIAEYEKLERESGIVFHHAVGCAYVDLEGAEGLSRKAIKPAEVFSVPYELYDPQEVHKAMPMIRFPEGLGVVLEHGGAGYINPRALVTAQLTVAKKRAEVIPQEVQRVSVQSNHVEVMTLAGNIYQAKKVLLATGAYTNFLLDESLQFTTHGVTTVLAEIDKTEFERLKTMPSVIIFDAFKKREPYDLYVLPPIKYPDGKYYVKIGGNIDDTPLLKTPESFINWFHSEGQKHAAELYEDALFSLIPTLKAKSIHSYPCVVTHTQHGRPYIDTLVANQVYVAAGGNGAAAKSSNEIGRLAAQLVMSRENPQDIFSSAH